MREEGLQTGRRQQGLSCGKGEAGEKIGFDLHRGWLAVDVGEQSRKKYHDPFRVVDGHRRRSG
jgi:hypothetical protein